MVFDRLWYPLSILLLAVIGAKLIGPHGGLQVDKKEVRDVTGLRGLTQRYITTRYQRQHEEVRRWKVKISHRNIHEILISVPYQ